MQGQNVKRACSSNTLPAYDPFGRPKFGFSTFVLSAPNVKGADNTKVENPNFGRPNGSYAGRVLELQARFTF